ncbi:F-box protein [Criblamydia sequanensis]|uniref:Membrane protein n=1 Tax=Candidatus Criblamydia sequanensis CRIB-18 TaxID=1437425 RepID=A0A090CYA6_9BACT|nr:F-box protein [Criblamydia sequanensis]CDR33467.1 putative membrane protein [Criblamydia sequanensis CRIB-18]
MNVSINTFPEELLINIFSYLEPKELANTALVSKKWNTLSCDNSLWKIVSERIPLELEYGEKGIKHALSKIRQITNYHELMEDFKTFSESIEENQTAFYECLFVKNSPCYFNIEFGVIKDPTKATEVVRQVLFVKKQEYNGSIVYGERSEYFRGRIPSALTYKELKNSIDNEIYELMSFLNKQIESKQESLYIGKDKMSKIKTIERLISIGSVAAIILGIAIYNFDFY